MSIGQSIFNNWNRLSRWPGGKWLFSRLVGRMVPYSGTIRANIRELEPGFAKVELPDHRQVRNHLGSIHAISLANLGELASGLAVMTGLPNGVRGILVGLQVEYVKKARGNLTCTSTAEKVSPVENEEHKIEAIITDESGDTVATVCASWMLGPEKNLKASP